MSKKLEELLNLPESRDIIEADVVEDNIQPHQGDMVFREISELDKITAALPQVKGLGDATDAEFDALANKAIAAYDDLMDLGMSVEAKYSSRVFEVASAMLKNAIDAKSAKVDKKLKMIDLQLRKYKLINKEEEIASNQGIVVNGDDYIVSDRNTLIDKLRSLKDSNA